MGKFVLSIIGPTAVGKTELAYTIAHRINGEIISSDSRQIYRMMDIGTDKPDENILEKIKHYFINIKNPDEYYSAGQYAKDAKKVILSIIEKGKTPIVVGGSGLYIRALFDGVFVEPKKDIELKNRLRKKAREKGTDILYNELIKIDPDYAEEVSPKDSQRIIRALEVFYTSGKKITEFWDQQEIKKFSPAVFIGLMRKREELYLLIEKRIDRMLESGLIEETEALLRKGYSKKLNAIQTIGYKEAIEFLDKRISYEEMVSLIKQKTRNYAKRQITWFKKDSRIDWFYKSENVSINDIANSIIQKYF